MPGHANGHSGNALGKTSRIFDSIEREARNGQEAGDKPLRQAAFIGANHVVGGEQSGAARGGSGRGSPAKLGEVIDRRSDPSLAFVVLGARLPAEGVLVRSRADFVRPQTGEMLALAVKRAGMRPKELVGRADQEIAVEPAHVDGAVGRVMDRVDEGQGSHGVRQANDLLHVVDGAHRIRGVAGGHQARPRGDLRLKSAISNVQSEGSISTKRTRQPRSSSAHQGATLPS